jgi:DmsE family decaheme c-type cytochrome
MLMRGGFLAFALLVAVCILSCVGLRSERPASFVAGYFPHKGAAYIGAEGCAHCHPKPAEFILTTVHAKAFFTEKEKGCESCHGPGSVHRITLERADIFRPSNLPEAKRSQLCLQCHQQAEKISHWNFSGHARHGVSCFDCHGAIIAPHIAAFQKTFLGKPIESYRPYDLRDPQLCLDCHREVSAQFHQPYAHPVRQGKLVCVDCHNPHADRLSVSRPRETARACLSCHAELRGPFVFRHEAIEESGCLVCHQPHGSVNNKLLTQTGNALCMQCHFQANYPTIGAVDHTGLLAGGRNCWSCHVDIHGSNGSRTFRNLEF